MSGMEMVISNDLLRARAEIAALNQGIASARAEIAVVKSGVDALGSQVGATSVIKSVQRGLLMIATGTKETTINVGAVNMDKSSLQFVGAVGWSDGSSINAGRIYLISPTQIHAIWSLAAGTGFPGGIQISWELIEYK